MTLGILTPVLPVKTVVLMTTGVHVVFPCGCALRNPHAERRPMPCREHDTRNR